MSKQILDFRNKKFILAFATALVVIILAIVIFALVRNLGGNGYYPTFAEAENGDDNYNDEEDPIDEDTDEDEDEEDDEPEPYEYDEPEEVDPRPRSVLTGLALDEEYVNRRPLAVVINNIHRALPQSGISHADIIYEVLTEGEITRFVAIFQSYIPEKIGPVRSTRDYFTDFAFNHGSIFIMHGGSPSGYTRARSTGIPFLDGMALEGAVFWRYRNYPDWHHNTGTRPMEHSSFTSRERIFNHVASAGIRNYMGDNPHYGFLFGTHEADSLGAANRVVVPFSPGYTRTFIFDPEQGHYLVENRDGPQRDATNREQLTATNILIQHTHMYVIPGCGMGYRNIRTVGEGSGYLATNGEYFEVRWVRDSHTSPTRWYFTDGSPLILTPGTTWVCVLSPTTAAIFTS